MSFKLSAEQREFQDSFRTFLSEQLPIARLRERAASRITSDDSLWRKYSQLGLMEFFTSAESHSSSLGLDLFHIAFECGYGLEPEGLWESLLVGPFLFFRLLPGACSQISDFETARFLPAVWRAHNSLTKDKAGVVSGQCCFVLGDGAAKYIVCEAKCTDGSPALSLVNIQENQARIRFERIESLDMTRVITRIAFDAVHVHLLSAAALTPLAQLYRALKASEVAGACARALKMTTEYVKTRKQFGVPVGGFQAVQHRLADMMLYVESMRAAAQFAAWSVLSSPQQAELSSRAAFAHAMECGPRVMESAVQLHGGIGFTWEYDLHLFLKRVKCIELLFSSDSDTRELVAVASALNSGPSLGGPR